MLCNAQDYPVAVVYTENRDEYNKKAKEWTKEYATEAVTPNEELVGVDSLV